MDDPRNSNGRKDHVELSLLGVDGSSEPSPSSFPSKFNQLRGLPVWTAMLSSGLYASALPALRSKDDRWIWCVRTYLRLCNKAGVFPFQTSTVQSNNDFVSMFLKLARRRAVTYIDNINLFRRLRILTSTRDFDFADGFTVKTTASMYPVRTEQLSELRSWATQLTPGPMFRATGKSGQFERLLFKNIDSFVSFHLSISTVRPVLSMTIKCATPIVYGHTRTPPSHAEALRFAESTFWTPLVMSNKFNNVVNRLF